MKFASFESARLKLTLLGDRPRILLRVGLGIIINCWVDQLGSVHAVGHSKLRLFAPPLTVDKGAPVTARNLWLFTFDSYLQFMPYQRLAWAKVSASRYYTNVLDYDLVSNIAEKIQCESPSSFHARTTFTLEAKQYATPARDRLLDRLLRFQHGRMQLYRTLSAQERQRHAAANAAATSAKREAAEASAHLAAVEAAVGALGVQAALTRSSSEVSAGFKQTTSSALICDLWKRLCLVGTAWTSYEEVHQHPAWDFGSWLWEKQLPDLLEQRSGLYLNKHCEGVADQRDHNAFVFGTTEPQLIGRQVVEIPVLVFIIAPPEWIEAAGLVALTSVQMEELELMPLADLGMEWRPMDWQPSGSATARVHYLHSNLRWSTIRKMGKEERQRFEYAIPYNPRNGDGSSAGEKSQSGDAVHDVRRVSLSYQPVDERGDALHSRAPIDLIFDKDDGHRLRTFIPEFLEDEELDDTPQQREALEDAIREAFRRARIAEADRMAQLARIQDQLSDEARNAVAQQFVVKAYPKVCDPRGFQSVGEKAGPQIDAAAVRRCHTKFVNRFLGNADWVCG
jgi:hypothetical protein